VPAAWAVDVLEVLDPVEAVVAVLAWESAVESVLIVPLILRHAIAAQTRMSTPPPIPARA